jgi:hypothetical protein
MREGQPGGVEVIEPQWQIVAVAGGDALQRGNEILPQRGVFLLGRLVLRRLDVLAQTGEQCGGRERGERQTKVGAGRTASIERNGLEQRQQPRLVVVFAGAGALVGAVVGLELAALEAGSEPVGGGDDPLQKGLWPVMTRGGVDQRIVGIRLVGAGEGRGQQDFPLRQQRLDGQEAGRGVGRMDVRRPAIPVRAVELFPQLEFLALAGQTRALGELAQIVHERRQRDATGCVKQSVRHVSSLDVMDIMQSGRAHGNCGKIADWLIMLAAYRA